MRKNLRKFALGFSIVIFFLALALAVPYLVLGAIAFITIVGVSWILGDVITDIRQNGY